MLARHNNMNAYSDIYEQYVDDIRELEERIEAQLDGLMTSTDVAWNTCIKALSLEEPGEVFVATVVAFRSHDSAKIQKAIEVGLTSDSTFKGLVSALGWLPNSLINPWIQKLFISKDLNHKYLALAACSVRRENPADYLKTHVKLYARALRLIGELKIC